jgi:hypothetical protein
MILQLLGEDHAVVLEVAWLLDIIDVSKTISSDDPLGIYPEP